MQEKKRVNDLVTFLKDLYPKGSEVEKQLYQEEWKVNISVCIIM